MKDDAILIDFGLHYKQMLHASYFWDQYKLKTIITDKKKNDLEDGNFNEIIAVRNNFLMLKMIIFCFFNAFNSKKVIVLTGPEYGNYYKYLIIRFLWFIFCLMFRQKIIIYVKNTSAYSKCKFLKKTCVLVDRCLFESELQRDSFLSKIKINKNKTGVVYVYYPDVFAKTTVENKSLTSKITVGLIGQFDINRRDYSELLSLLDENLLAEDYEFIQIGRFIPSDQATKIKNKYYGRLRFIKDDFSSKEIDEYISSCDVLLSMNKKASEYAHGKGTAAFGEAIAARKPLIVPSFLNIYTEFKDVCKFYNDDKTLIDALKESAKLNLVNQAYRKYESKNVMLNLSNEYCI